MPSVNLPNLNIDIDNATDEGALNNILDTLQLYRKELNFLLMNLDGDNMPTILGRLEDGEGNMSLISQTVDSIQMTVANNTGDIANLQITANSISSTVANQAGQISQLTQTAQGIQTQVSNQAGQISTLTQTAQGLQSTVTSQGTAISNLTQTAQGLQSTVTSINSTLVNQSSQITQLSGSISSKVSKGEVISEINQTPESVKISANKIDLTGVTAIYGGSGGVATFSAYGDFIITRYANTVFRIYNGIGYADISSYGNTILTANSSGATAQGRWDFAGSVNFSGASVSGLPTPVIDRSKIIEPYYSANKCYIDYSSSLKLLVVRDKSGAAIGNIPIT